MFECTVSFWDGGFARYYEEGNTYEIDLDYMSKLGVLNRFDGAEEAYKALHKPVVKKVEKHVEKPVEKPVEKEEKPVSIEEAISTVIKGGDK